MICIFNKIAQKRKKMFKCTPVPLHNGFRIYNKKSSSYSRYNILIFLCIPELLFQQTLQDAIVTSNRSRIAHETLYPPGHIMYIEEAEPKRYVGVTHLQISLINLYWYSGRAFFDFNWVRPQLYFLMVLR